MMGRMDDVQLRRAVPADARAIAEVHVDGWRWGYRGQLPAAFLRDLSMDRREVAWREDIADPDLEVWVADRVGAVVGFTAFGRSRDGDAEPTTGELGSIYVSEAAAGAGIGRALMVRTLDRLAETFQEATLWVLESNAATRRFYEAFGWRPDGATKTDTVRGVELHEIRYRIDLR